MKLSSAKFFSWSVKFNTTLLFKSPSDHKLGWWHRSLLLTQMDKNLSIYGAKSSVPKVQIPSITLTSCSAKYPGKWYWKHLQKESMCLETTRWDFNAIFSFVSAFGKTCLRPADPFICHYRQHLKYPGISTHKSGMPSGITLLQQHLSECWFSSGTSLPHKAVTVWCPSSPCGTSWDGLATAGMLAMDKIQLLPILQPVCLAPAPATQHPTVQSLWRRW